MKIASTILTAIIALLLAFSAFGKLTGAEAVVTGLAKMGLGSYVTVIGIAELIFVGLFVYPKTSQWGFLFLCCYLGGAASIELAGGAFPIALVLITLLWISMFLKNKAVFLHPATN